MSNQTFLEFIGATGRVPNGYWKDIENFKIYMKWLGRKLGYTNMEDWYKISQKDFRKNSPGGSLINQPHYNSTVNMVSPGIVDTKLIKDLPPKFIEIAAYQNPLKRIADVKDVSNIISFLASDESDYLNGVNIPVNGGNNIL